MNTQLLKKIASVLLLAAGVMSVSCGDNGDNSGINAGNSLQIRMHDFPIKDQDVEKVIVEISRIEVHSRESGWKTVEQTPRKYDLLELQDGKTAIILNCPLPIGTYTQIRLQLSEDNEIVANDLTHPLKVPSGTESGIKLITPFDVTLGKIVVVTLDFDAQKSVTYTKGDGFHLKPVIKVEKIDEYDGAGVVAPEGGNVTTVDGILNIQVPTGAVNEKVMVTAEKAGLSGLPTPDETMESVGIAYELGPDGLEFNTSVLLTFHYHEADLAGIGAERDLALYRYDETAGAWIAVPSDVAEAADLLQAWVDHFSLYALFVRRYITPPPLVPIQLPSDVIGQGALTVPSMPLLQNDDWSCGVHSANRLMRAYGQVEDYNSMRDAIGSYELSLSYNYTIGLFIPSPLPCWPCPTWRNPFKICCPSDILIKEAGIEDIGIETGIGKPDKILVGDLQQKYRPTFRTLDRQNLSALLHKIDSGKPVMTIIQRYTESVDLMTEIPRLLTGWFIIGPDEIRYPQLHWVVVYGYDDQVIRWYDTYDNDPHTTPLTDFYYQWNWQKESFDYAVRRLLEDEFDLHPRTMMWIDETLPGWTPPG